MSDKVKCSKCNVLFDEEETFEMDVNAKNGEGEVVHTTSMVVCVPCLIELAGCASEIKIETGREFDELED